MLRSSELLRCHAKNPFRRPWASWSSEEDDEASVVGGSAVSSRVFRSHRLRGVVKGPERLDQQRLWMLRQSLWNESEKERCR